MFALLSSSCKDYDKDISALEDEIIRLEDEIARLNNLELVKLIEEEKAKVKELEEELQRLKENGQANEDEIKDLEETISLLKNVIDLQMAYYEKKIIKSASEVESGNLQFWLLTFNDNTNLLLRKDLVKSLTLNDETDEYTIVLTGDKTFVFNHRKEIVYPTGITLLTQQISYMKGTEVAFEFRVNPSNAKFNYDVTSDECDIKIDRTGDAKTYSYVNTPDNYSIVNIEPSKDSDGNVKDGQYKAYLRDRGGHSPYKDAVALVVSSRDVNGDPVELSSSAMYVERKKDTYLPVVVIHTENDQAILNKEDWIPGTMTIDGAGKFDNYEGTLGIRGRGNFTWTMPKKPFAIKLDSKSEILGMPTHKRWVLLANYMDRTLLRNRIAFEISNRTGLEWTPRGEYVEVMLNDVHLGNYYLCEQIKVDKNRVNVAEMSATDLEGDDITGGYLMELDTYYDEVNKFMSATANLPVMFKEPDEETLQPAQFEYMRSYIDSVESLLYNNDSLASRAYTSMIADTTFIDFWFVQELTTNREINHPKSSYMYKDRNGLLKMGPVWDFDVTTFCSISGFCVKNAIWYSRLFKDPVFVSKVKERWAKFKPSFEEVELIIDDARSSIELSAGLNEIIWPMYNREIINNDEKLAFKDAVDLLKENYRARIILLNNLIRGL
jgi:hypothetical protein